MLHDRLISDPVTRPDALGATVTVGMPQLSYGGLSENWLWKECGHRHWLMLASKLGLSGPDFQDAQGNRLYAAFVAIRLADADLASVKENDELEFTTVLDRVSYTQYLSHHIIRCRNRIVANVAMTSAFLRRTVSGSNRHVERATANTHINPQIIKSGNGLNLVALAQQFRSDRWTEHLGFRSQEAAELAKFEFRPCPQNDFNGADFLYFASFQSIADRALWNSGPDVEARTTARHREIFFYGNLDVGDHLCVTLCGVTEAQAASSPRKVVRRWNKITRKSDQKPIADIFTVKEM